MDSSGKLMPAEPVLETAVQLGLSMGCASLSVKKNSPPGYDLLKTPSRHPSCGLRSAKERAAVKTAARAVTSWSLWAGGSCCGNNSIPVYHGGTVRTLRNWVRSYLTLTKMSAGHDPDRSIKLGHSASPVQPCMPPRYRASGYSQDPFSGAGVRLQANVSISNWMLQPVRQEARRDLLSETGSILL